MSSKIKDGLFMGDVDAAQDADFLQLNGIVHIVNCVPRQVPNLFQQSLNISYVACELDEVLRRPFFDLKNREFMRIFQLIESALERTESVLIHCLHGTAQSPSFIMGYLMVKYCWGVDKAYDFLLTKRSDIKPHETYVEQLCNLEAQLQQMFPKRATESQLYEWQHELVDRTSDELVLVHTYLNCANRNQRIPPNQALLTKSNGSSSSKKRVSWIDEHGELRKLHPNLLAKPERPPNHSYNNMLPANGWVDTSQSTSARSYPGGMLSTFPRTNDPAPVLRDRMQFTDLSFSAPNSESTTCENANGLKKSGRIHSFSLPKRHDSQSESQGSLSPLSVGDQDDSECVVEVSQPKGGRQLPPRYLQYTRSSMNSRPRRVSSSRPGVYRMPSMPVASKSTTSSAPALSRTTSSSYGKASTTRESEQVREPSNASREPRSSAAKNSASRLLFTSDLPEQSRGSRRGLHGQKFASSNENATTSAPGRPRTAPARTHRREIDPSDVLQTKKLEVGVGSAAMLLNRIVLEAPNRTRPSTGSSDPSSSRPRSRMSASVSSSSTTSSRPTRSRVNSRSQWK